MTLLRRIHRYASLAFALFWLLQALTGLVLTFRFELDDMGVPGPRAYFDPQRLGEAVMAIENKPDTTVDSFRANDASNRRYDIFYHDQTGARTARVDGLGHPLRDNPDAGWTGGNVFDRLHDLHVSLWAGTPGKYIIGLSGLLLISNILIGLNIAWPRPGRWKQALRLPPSARGTGALYAWHRGLGLWLSLPALVLISAGVLMAFDKPLIRALQAETPVPDAQPQGLSPSAPGVSPSQAMTLALGTFPGGTISRVWMPTEKTPWYRIRVRAAGELPRIWGRSTVYVAIDRPDTLTAYDASKPGSASRALFDNLYIFHTGQAGGLAGRLMAMAVGVWLIALAGLGGALWYIRRTKR